MIVEMLMERDGEPNILGDRVRYPKGWLGEMDEDLAGYFLAIGCARSPKPLPDDLAAGVETLRAIVTAFRAQRVEPTYRDVYLAVARADAALERTS